MSNLECEDDFELENLRLAALKSMQSKASTTKPVIDNVNCASNSNFNNNNIQINQDRQNNFIKKPRKNFQKNHPLPKFNQPPSSSQFQPPPFSNPPPQSQFNNQPQQFNSTNTGSSFINDFQQYFNQFDNDQFNNVPQKFNKVGKQFKNNPQQQFNAQPPPHQQAPQFSNKQQFVNNQQPQFNNQPQQYKNQQFPPQFNPPPPQFNQPRSNLIVLTAENSSKGVVADHQMSNYLPHTNHQPQQHFRNGYNKPMNKRFHNNKQSNYNRRSNQDEIKLKDVPTDLNKNAASLPSRFSRIDKDSSSDEDEESDSDDNDIEKYRQTYFDTNDTNGDEDTQDTQPDKLSTTSKDDQEDERNVEDLLGLEDENMVNDLNTNFEVIEPVERKNDSFNEVDKPSEDNKANEDDKLGKDVELNDSSKEDSRLSNSNNSTNDLTDKMVLRNKKRLSDQDRDANAKVPNTDANRCSKSDDNISSKVHLKDTPPCTESTDTSLNQDSSTRGRTTDHSKDEQPKVRERKKIVFNKEDFEDRPESNDDNRTTRRTTRKLSSIIECNSSNQSSNHPRLKSRVKSISDESNNTECVKESSTKRLRSLVVRK